MCAIIGQIGGKIDKEKFIQARDLMKNRGPDDCGMCFNEKDNLAFGHRRLSILDLSLAGHQPMFSQDNRYAIVFNGEIFNFIELKKELAGYKFKTKTDTEVLLAAYIKWGADCLNRLNGQFAFAVYDTNTREVFCARDHFGIKPFYYLFNGRKFLFASEIKSLLALGVKPKANDKIIFEYLKYGLYDHSEDTFFDGIKKLMPGQYALYKEGNLKLVTYWDLSHRKDGENQYKNLSENEAMEELKCLINNAVRFQFRSDVPVGLTLSSGIDSMSLLFFANKVSGDRIRLFSGAVDDKDFDETQFLDRLLRPAQKKFLTTSMLVPDKIWPLAEKLLTIQDEPYGGLSTISYFNLYEETKMKGVTVLLEGQGMDEIMAGYKYYSSKNSSGVSQDNTNELVDGFLDRDFCKKHGGRRLDFPKPFRSDLLNKQYRDIRYTKLPRVLRFNDHISLAYGKELRIPYLDRKLAEFCFFLPQKFKISGGKHKVLLREMMVNAAPGFVENKPKFPFGAFQTSWFRKYFKDDINNIIESNSFKSRPYWQWSKVKSMLDDFLDGHGNNSFFLWQWVNLEMWFRKYIDKGNKLI